MHKRIKSFFKGKAVPGWGLVFLMVMTIASCQKEFSCETCGKANRVPEAVAGGDQVIRLPLDSIWLDGTGSNDPDGSISAYRWREISGPAPSTIVSPAVSATWVRTLLAGLYQFELTVTDDGGLSSRDTISVTVQSPGQQNQPPVACAGPDQSITLPINNVILDGRCSADPDKDISTYLWTKLSGPAAYQITNPDQPLTPVTGLGQGVFVFQLTVRDQSGLMSMDTVRVTVNSLPMETDSLDVYVAGDENSAPVYWKNGQAISLPISPFQNGSASAIVVDGNDVYVAGWEGDFLIIRENRAKYWKNGQEVFLTGATGAVASDIAVSGADVYVAGWELSGGISVAKYWKNGIAVSLTDGSKNAEARGIVVVGGDVYVSGYEGNIAKYWRNGQPAGPSSATYPSYGGGLAVEGNDVYLAGSQTGKATYWRNGQAITLSGGSESSTARSIFVSGGDVFVAGEKGDYGKTVARYWKNGQETLLSTPTEAMLTTSIFVWGNDVYVTGFEYGYNYRSGYWKNGQFVQVGSRDAQSADILVKRR
jgi:hypothetical protein